MTVRVEIVDRNEIWNLQKCQLNEDCIDCFLFRELVSLLDVFTSCEKFVWMSLYNY